MTFYESWWPIVWGERLLPIWGWAIDGSDIFDSGCLPGHARGEGRGLLFLDLGILTVGEAIQLPGGLLLAAT